MVTRTYLTVAFGLSLGGALFAGYLSLVKFVTQRCAFSEPCPTFLGYPACWFGFALFSTLFVVATFARFGELPPQIAIRLLQGVSLLGILFAGYYTFLEVAAWLATGIARSALVLPTCAYGLIFYLLIFGLSFAII